jgi:hypothetical protein
MNTSYKNAIQQTTIAETAIEKQKKTQNTENHQNRFPQRRPNKTPKTYPLRQILLYHRPPSTAARKKN